MPGNVPMRLIQLCTNRLITTNEFLVIRATIQIRKVKGRPLLDRQYQQKLIPQRGLGDPVLTLNHKHFIGMILVLPKSGIVIQADLIGDLHLSIECETLLKILVSLPWHVHQIKTDA